MIKQRVAVLAKHLATLRLTPQHAAIAVRMAISKNIDAQNYGVASNLLQVATPSNSVSAWLLVLTPFSLCRSCVYTVGFEPQPTRRRLSERKAAPLQAARRNERHVQHQSFFLLPGTPSSTN
jgi:hypothetical protein